MQSSTTKPTLNFAGTLVSLRLSANDNADGISIIEHKMAFGEAPPLHVHRAEDEVFHVLNGQMRFEIGGKTITAATGDIIVAPKGVPHRFIVESADGAHCLTIMKGRNFEDMVLEMSQPMGVVSLPARHQPTPDMIAALSASCARNGIDIIGPPLAA